VRFRGGNPTVREGVKSRRGDKEIRRRGEEEKGRIFYFSSPFLLISSSQKHPC